MQFETALSDHQVHYYNTAWQHVSPFCAALVCSLNGVPFPCRCLGLLASGLVPPPKAARLRLRRALGRNSEREQ